MKTQTVKIGYAIYDNHSEMDSIVKYSCCNLNDEFDYPVYGVKTFVLVAMGFDLSIDAIHIPEWDNPAKRKIDYNNSLFVDQDIAANDVSVLQARAKSFFDATFCLHPLRLVDNHKRPSLGKITPLENISFEISYKSKRSLEKSIEEKLISLANGISLEWETSLEGIVKYFENMKK